jgi:hemoglobin
MFRRMKHILSCFAAICAALTLAVLGASAAEPAAKSADTQAALICPITGKPADPNITVVYEGKTYAFADQASRKQFNEAREKSLYQQLGGKAAIDAAVEAFYVKVLADDRIKHFFEDINMNKQRRKQKEFLYAALGGPIPWTGKDLRKAHSHIPGLNESHFNAVAEDLQQTLEDLKVKKEVINQVMAAVGSLKADVLNLPKK